MLINKTADSVLTSMLRSAKLDVISIKVPVTAQLKGTTFTLAHQVIPTVIVAGVSFGLLGMAIYGIVHAVKSAVPKRK